MLVKMKFQMSGYRMVPDSTVKTPGQEGYRAVSWPEPGSVVDLPDDEAATLLRNGMAEEVVVERAVPADNGVEKRATVSRKPAAKQVSKSE